MIPLVLASGSPRRRALLEALGLDLTVLTSDAEETNAGTVPDAIVEANARLKLEDVCGRLTGEHAVIAADTLVFHGSDVLGKPATLDEARAMLHKLSGQTHQVVTGIAVAHTSTNVVRCASETTSVCFRTLSSVDIERFVTAVNPLDRAGAYTVDGPGSLLVARYEGCYQNVLGLPMVCLHGLLLEIGVDLFERVHPEKAAFL